ncbi:teichoic acid ABC transporter ATP-binding protein [Clostridium sp. W14A]|jgi:ABC-2 type transport system ATP-binding protein|nr:teichoic acid ABC transporter ATP-binding protein [Clostridium sp. W14A]
MTDNMIEVQDVSMRFRLANDRILSIKEFVTAKLSGKLTYQDFWALKNISFEMKKGEVVGVIGRNGAGKSTLLKIISGIMKPTTGRIICHGNVVPMLELGSGFDFDLTGRENIFLNGAILGYTQEFLESRYQEILDFSELGRFIDIPIRNYSSGMMMRLAFSIATMVHPDILIVDEILSVGDEAFQKKSYTRMMELMNGGTTVLFVSHSLNQIRTMCNRVIWLDNGELRMFGDVQEVCDTYISSVK